MSRARGAPRRTIRWLPLVVAVGCGGRIMALDDEPGLGASAPMPDDEPSGSSRVDPPSPRDASYERDDGDGSLDSAVRDAGARDVAVADAKDCDALATCAGTCGLGRCIEQLAVGQDNPIALALDDANVYWLNVGDGGVGRGSVSSVPKSGGVAPTTLVANQTRPRQIVTDGTTVYWTTPPNVMSVPATGGPPAVVATGVAPIAITLDASYLYWIDAKKGGLGDLVKQPRGGGPPVVLSDTGSNALRLAVSDTAAFFFNGFGTDRLETTPLAGGPRSYFHLFNTLGAAMSGIAIDAANVYVTFDNSGGAVVACPLPSGDCTIISNGNNGARAIASDGSFAYFLSPHGGAGALTGVVRRAPVAGGPTQVIAVSGHDLVDIAVDATSVYWINRTAGTISKLTPK